MTSSVAEAGEVSVEGEHLGRIEGFRFIPDTTEGQTDQKAVLSAALRALRSGQYILGKESAAFEAELAAHTGTTQCVLGSSWTMIVYLLHQLQGVGPGDEIIVPSHTAFPSMEPLIHLGARPVFADIDDTYVMDLAHVESLITPRTVGIIGVHLYGHPIDNDDQSAVAGHGQDLSVRRARDIKRILVRPGQCRHDCARNGVANPQFP